MFLVCGSVIVNNITEKTMEQIFVTFPIYVRHGKTKQFRRVICDWDCFKLLKLYTAVRLLATLRKNKWLDCSCNFHEKSQISHKEQSGTFSENYVKPPGYRIFFLFFWIRVASNNRKTTARIFMDSSKYVGYDTEMSSLELLTPDLRVSRSKN